MSSLIHEMGWVYILYPLIYIGLALSINHIGHN